MRRAGGEKRHERIPGGDECGSGADYHRQGVVLAELEAREILEDDRRRQYGEALGIRDYIHLEEYDKSIMASLIASAQVMGEDRLEVTWKYHDVYEKILGEMQG